jgi:hypothetical protein
VTWLSWRQQRTETLITAALLALLAVAFIPTGIHLADLFAQEHIARCINRHSEECGLVVGGFAASPGFLRSLFDGGWLNFIPGLIGVALAVPLLLDLENGTVRLAWTQSITRRRWIATKLGVAVGTVILAAGAFSGLFTWYQQPLARIFGRWDKFDFAWFVPLGYALFAFGMALAVGVLLRRNGAALVVAFVVYVAARLFDQSWLRQRLVTPATATFGPHSAGPNVSDAWVISESPSDKAGHLLSQSASVFRLCASPGGGGKGGGAKGLIQACMNRHGAGYTHILYQPASRFWEFQGIETALFGGIALVLLSFAAWRVLRVD